MTGKQAWIRNRNSFDVHARAVLFVLAAEEFPDVGMRNERVGDLEAEGARVHLRIVDRDFLVEASEIAAPEPFGQAQRVAVGMTDAVEPALVVEAHRAFTIGLRGPSWSSSRPHLTQSPPWVSRDSLRETLSA